MLSDQEKQKVRERADFRCEYCRAPENVAGYAFHLEHIIPRHEKGPDSLDNIALSCVQCNRAKWHHIFGIDPESGGEAPLFNPRTDLWSDHFRVQRRIYIQGKTAIGRATESRLALNHSRQLAARRLWLKIGLFP